MPQTDPWTSFDKIYCITLADRPDRRDRVRAEFKSVGLSHRVEFVRADRHPFDSEKGIYLSHLSCLRQGIRAGARTMAVFEDDVVFEGFCPDRLGRCVDFLSARPGWRVLFFGCLVRKSRPTASPDVVEIDYRSLAHAYAIHGDFARVLLKKPWQQIPFDAILGQFKGGYFATYPAFAFQSDAASDNTRLKGLDRLRRVFGGLKRIQKVNEWYCRNKPLVIAIHILVALLLILPLVW